MKNAKSELTVSVVAVLVSGRGVDVLDTAGSDLLAVGECVQRLVTSAIPSDKQYPSRAIQ